MFAVIIVARNEGRSVSRSIESILNHRNNTNDIEIVVVDDGSTDNTTSEAKKHNVKVITLPKKMGISYCRNLGVNNSTSKYLLFFDAHSYLNGKKDIFEELHRCFDNDVDLYGISGYYETLHPDDLNHIRDLIRNTYRLKTLAKVEIDFDRYTTFSSCIGCIRREAFASYQFPEHFINGADEDLLFQIKLMNEGKKFLHLKSLKCWHDAIVDHRCLFGKILYNAQGFSNLMYEFAYLNLKAIPYSPFLLDFPVSLLFAPIIVFLLFFPSYIYLNVMIICLLFIIDFYKFKDLILNKGIKAKLKISTIVYILLNEYTKGVYFLCSLFTNKYTGMQLLYTIKLLFQLELIKLKLIKCAKL